MARTRPADPPVASGPPQAGRPNHRRRRRGLWVVLGVVTLTLLMVFTACSATFLAAWNRAETNTAGQIEFTRLLAVPPLAESRIDADGRRVFDLHLQTGSTDFGLGRPTETLGINGTYLGPTVRVAQGERVAVNVTNDIGESTTLHWHGMRLPAEADGGPHQMIRPGETWSPSWEIDQPAATLWYHPHLHGRTAEHVNRGLAGMLIVDDSSASELALPNDYGVDDLPVIVQDRKFTGDGQFAHDSAPFSPTGVLGDTVLVNGTLAPYHEVSTDKMRLRLLNASSARIYNFGLEDADGTERGFALVGTDGGLLPHPVESDRIQLSPGERAEIVVSMQPGEDLVLRSHPADLGVDSWSQRLSGGDDTLDILQLRAADRLTRAPDLPENLAAAPDLSAADATVTRTFRLSGTNINGRKMDMDRIDEVVTAGDTEIWEVTSTDGIPHTFHVHDAQFQVLDVNADAPAPALRGWKDTVYIAPDTTVRLIMRFGAHTNSRVPYMYHCHLLQHEDQGMMGQFVVVAPGHAGHPGVTPH